MARCSWHLRVCTADALDDLTGLCGDHSLEARIRARNEADTGMLGAIIETRRCGMLRREIGDLAVDAMRVIYLRETARAFVESPGTDAHEVLRRLPPWERFYATEAWLAHLTMTHADTSVVYFDLALLGKVAA
jgi:hypothetical protein